MLARPQQSLIRNDLEKKMVFLTGPRQVGKTWLARRIAEAFEGSVYLNYDSFVEGMLQLHQEPLEPLG